MVIKKFTFNPFQENTYIVSAPDNSCFIIDPGCHIVREEMELQFYIKNNNLKPKAIISTHSHIDHILGNHYCASSFNIPLGLHKLDEEMLNLGEATAKMYQIPYTKSVAPSFYLQEGEDIVFGDEKLEVRFTPGHAPGHVVFISHKDKVVIAGDVLFYRSVGRMDLPGGDEATLKKSIIEQLYTLPDDYKVYCGHGPETFIGDEKTLNPFVRV